MKFEYSDLN